MSTPPVAIVIPLFNDAKTIAACVRGVLEHTEYPDWQIVVVDDGSTDGGAKLLREFPAVKIIRKNRGGVASALNAGFIATPGRDVVRLHADVVVDSPDWLARLAEAAYAQPKAGVVGGRLVYPDGRIHSEGRHIVSGLGLHPQHCHRRAFLPDGAPGKVQEVDTVPGALAYYRRDVIEQVGGLDESFGPAWFDDDDFCIGARMLGYKVYVHGGVKAVHYTRAQAPTFQSHVPHMEAEFNKLLSLVKLACQRIQATYWEAKWGWNPLYPDLGEIRRLYGHTEICWQIGEPLRYQPTDATPTVDCCLVAYNTLPLLRRCLESLARTDYPADRLNVYVADNASTDGTPAYLEELARTYPFPLHVVSLAVNTGAPVGLNFAVVQGKGELVARLDDDIVLPPGWLKTLVADLVQRPFAGCVGPKIINDSESHSIQCGPYRHFPTIFGHEDEADHGQADYVARTTHVRGCCNLYRRDAFVRCGLLDARFSPSQCDDPDHHIALLQAGFEILYDGRVAVVHKLNNGLSRTHAALSNLGGNVNKLRGKWGQDAYQILERSLDLSREGRCLPDDFNTATWLEQGPPPGSYPRQAAAMGARLHALLFKPYTDLCDSENKGDLGRWIDEHLVRAKLCAQSDGMRSSVEILQCALNLAPARVDVITELAGYNHALGQGELARTIARNGLRLAPDDAALQAHAAAAGAVVPAMASILQHANVIGEHAVGIAQPAVTATPGGLRVLMVNTYEGRLSGGDMHQVKKTRQYLQKLGLHVDICCAPRPDPRGYDVVHVWNTWFPAQTLVQVKAVRAWRPETPIVLSPIFWDMREKTWADEAVPSIFNQSTTPAHLQERLGHLASGQLVFNGCTRSAAREANYQGYDAYQKALLGLVDHLLPQSCAELANLKKIHGIELPSTLVHNGAETAVFDRATPEWCVKQYGLKDFVLVVGLVEPRKNQLMLLHALRDTNLRVVIVGRHYNHDHAYYQLCQRHAPPGTLFIDHLPHEQLASLFKAARVHALPSWMECASFANVEAALSGCALAVSDRTSEKEYFGDNAYYCDPASVTSIRNGVMAAWNNHAKDAPKRERLIEQFRAQFTWERAAAATLAGYHAAIASRQRAAA